VRRRTEPRSSSGASRRLSWLDRLDQAFLFSRSIDETSYSRQRDKLRDQLVLAQIDHHTDAVDGLDVEVILAFAERILPRASDLWVQAPLDYKQWLQQLFFPEGTRTSRRRAVSALDAAASGGRAQPARSGRSAPFSHPIPHSPD
jgi:hypothetical protein